MEVTNGSTRTSDGVDVAWDRRGRGTPLVLVHGFTDYRSLMEPLANRFAVQHDVVNIDVRGHGNSGYNHDFTWKRLCTDIVEVCDDLKLSTPILVGHSVGGLLVTGAAAGVGARAVVNIDQSLDRNATAHRVSQVAEKLRDPASFHATLDALFSGENTPGLDAALQTELDQCAWKIDPTVVLGIWYDLLDGPNKGIASEVEAMMARVTMPYLMYLGSDPEPEYVAWLKAHIPTVEFAVFVGEAHFLHLANPDRLVAHVQSFIRS